MATPKAALKHPQAKAKSAPQGGVSDDVDAAEASSGPALGKREATCIDKLLWLLLVTSGVCLLAALVPGAAWRKHKNAGEFGRRWIWDRTYSLLTIGSTDDHPMGWHHMAKRVCERYANMVIVKDVTILERSVEKAVLSSREHPMIGGAFFGCEFWDVCKDHVAARCVNYSAFMYSGITSAGLLLAAVFCTALAVFFQARERYCHFLNELQQAQNKGCSCTVVGAILAYLGTVSWIVRSKELIAGLQETGFYPLPQPALAYYQALAASNMLVLAFGLAAWRRYATWEERNLMEKVAKKTARKQARERTQMLGAAGKGVPSHQVS
eukprot:TRINITY_DN121868_c0_g1_i1.p1 TRINITY_DN121868_c0_g1~~TRINITY_DN121868_c0_g1_i1.p1  ORF type:complete len:324 (-),score=44.09 TRINITY_DN121868_c0_g1_i1:112-1083(-)